MAFGSVEAAEINGSGFPSRDDGEANILLVVVEPSLVFEEGGEVCGRCSP